MRDRGWDLFRKGLRRRRKEVRRLSFMMGLAVFLTAFVLLFQDNINAYVMQNNYRDYGRWLFRAEEGAQPDSPYLDWESVYIGGYIQLLHDLTPVEIGSEEEGETPEAKEPEERIFVPVDQNSRETQILIGSLGADFAEENGIGLYEGRLPENAGEIAMELGALQQLGLSYELGQEVSFYLAEPELIPASGPDEADQLVMNRVRFTLCGTLERYTARWNEGSALPGALISREAYDGLVMDKEAYDFGMLKPEFTKGDVWRFAEELIGEIKTSEKQKVEAGSLVANEAAYYNPFWGDPALYRGMIGILLILCISLVTYLISSYLTKRRKFFLRLREIGASSGEVWKMAAYECALGAFPGILAGIAAAFASSLIAVLIMTKAGGADWFYVFSGKTLLRILLCITATFGLSLSAALLVFSGRGISEKRRGLTKAAASALRRRAERDRMPGPGYGETLKRDRLSHPLATALKRLAAILVTSVLIFCLDTISISSKNYHISFAPFWGEASSDVKMVYKVPQGPKGTQKVDAYISRSLRKTIPDAFFEELAEKPGVASFLRQLQDGFREISWEGKDENAAYRQYLETYAEEKFGNYNNENPAADAFLKQVDQSLIDIRVRENAEELWKDQGLGENAPYYEAFLAGNAVILEAEHDYIESTGLASGVTLRLPGKNGELELTVAAVSEIITPLKTVTLYGSGAFAGKLKDLEGAAGQWNVFTVTFDELSYRENTAKALAELCARYGLGYMSTTELLQELEDQLIRDGITYGFFALSLLILFLFMAFSVSAERDQRLRDKRILMRKLGAEEKTFAGERGKEAVREALWGLSALPLALAARWYLNWLKLGNNEYGMTFVSKILGRLVQYGPHYAETGESDSRELVAWIETLEERQWLWLLIPLVLAVLLTALAYGRAGKGENDD